MALEIYRCLTPGMLCYFTAIEAEPLDDGYLSERSAVSKFMDMTGMCYLKEMFWSDTLVRSGPFGRLRLLLVQEAFRRCATV